MMKEGTDVKGNERNVNNDQMSRRIDLDCGAKCEMKKKRNR
jgi:hypothetical protein